MAHPRRSEVWLLPAHFLHSEGNFQFHDPVAKHIAKMEGFQRRYMVSNKILRLWAAMVRQLEVRMIVPQHGAPIAGRQAIADFYDWVESLMCGVDLFDDRAYQLPTARIDAQSKRVMANLRVA